MRDLVHFVNKSTFVLQELGEVQTGFNSGFAIDGTNDSMKIEVFSFYGNELEPYTIVRHDFTNTWWIVDKDTVERYPNESGFFYKHTLMLSGAIELFNARDLTDCGFYQDNYTIEDYFNRLIKLSTLEFSENNIQVILNDNGVISKTKEIDYIKTFENYTLLSALREFFDDFNCTIKLRFEVELSGTDYIVKRAIVDVYSKTGNIDTPLNESVFNGVKEKKSITKNSFGTSVVSNGENVVSTQNKLYPATGTVKLSSKAYTIDRANAVLRLPSDVFRVNWLQMVRNYSAIIKDTVDSTKYITTPLFESDDYDYIYQKLNNWLTNVAVPVVMSQNTKDELLANIEQICKNIQLDMRITLYTGWTYDPISDKYYKPNNTNPNFYIPSVHLFKNDLVPVSLYNGQLVIGSKDEHDCVQYQDGCIYYERGSNLIQNFAFLGQRNEYTSDLQYPTIEQPNRDYPTDLQSNIIFDGSYAKIYSGYDPDSPQITYNTRINLSNVSFRVNYIPMTDLKIKYDNSSESRDSKLYNQNGKLTDSVALSKSLLSYSKQIESDTITKYATFYDFDEVPFVGRTVNINDEIYVINNISLDFYQNENDIGSTHGYYIIGEFNMSKKIAVKSIMVSPNTDIRDYGIPQSNNVKRKQLYRDFYEFSRLTNTWETPVYLDPNKIINTENTYVGYQEHVAVIKVQYESAFGGGGTYEDGTTVQPSDTWYYQLETTTYIMKKSIYEVLDFKDNNIIGYSSQNVISAFDFSRLLTGLIDTINTPISYTDDDGKVMSFDIAFCTLEQLISIYDEYVDYENTLLGSSYDGELYNYSVFIPEEIYEGDMSSFIIGAKNNFRHDFMIEEHDYYKDPLEVPVFEYSCQIDNSDDVIIGDDILSGKQDDIFFYYYIEVEKGTINENNWNSLNLPKIAVWVDDYNHTHNSLWTKAAKLDFTNNKTLRIRFYSYLDYDMDNDTFTYSPSSTWSNLKGKDLVIIRYRYGNKEKYDAYQPGAEFVNAKTELMFVIKGQDSDTTQMTEVNLIANHYKIK